MPQGAKGYFEKKNRREETRDLFLAHLFLDRWFLLLTFYKLPFTPFTGKFAVVTYKFMEATDVILWPKHAIERGKWTPALAAGIAAFSSSGTSLLATYASSGAVYHVANALVGDTCEDMGEDAQWTSDCNVYYRTCSYKDFDEMLSWMPNDFLMAQYADAVTKKPALCGKRIY